MSEPVHIAAIDAGSNAVRLSVARAYSALDIEPLHNERYSLRLGEGVFLRHRFSEDLFKKGVKAFRHFKEIMDEFGVTRYRAVATSASREARNRDAFVRQIKHKAGIALQVISGSDDLGTIAHCTDAAAGRSENVINVTLANRSAGFFARQRRTTASSAGARTASPVRRLKHAWCHGHRIVSPTTSPSASGP